MGVLSGCSFRTILFVFALYSMCHVIEVVQGRFLWDLSLYCINYCSRTDTQMPPISVCSCHRITSYHRRTAFNHFQTASKRDFNNHYFQEPMNNNK
jgi:hypothetical protein